MTESLSTSDPTGGDDGADRPGQPGAPPAPGVDVVRLADRVYRLMQAEARLSRSRGQRAQRQPPRR